MIIEDIRKISSTPKDLREFGLTVGAVFGILSAIFIWREKSYWIYTCIASAVLILPALLIPCMLKPAHKTWMTLAILMGSVVTPIVLGVLFFVAITPFGLLMKITGKDLLDLKFEKDKPSYWKPKQTRKFSPEDYEKQF
jgi:hypothetical protein